MVLPQVAERQVVFGNTYKVKKEQSKEITNAVEPSIFDIAASRLINHDVTDKRARGIVAMLLSSFKNITVVKEKEKLLKDAVFKLPETVTQADRVVPYLTRMIQAVDVVNVPEKVFGTGVRQLTADDVLTAGPAMQDYYRRKKEMEVINLVNSGAVNKEQIGWFYGS